MTVIVRNNTYVWVIVVILLLTIGSGYLYMNYSYNKKIENIEQSYSNERFRLFNKNGSQLDSLKISTDTLLERIKERKLQLKRLEDSISKIHQDLLTYEQALKILRK